MHCADYMTKLRFTRSKQKGSNECLFILKWMQIFREIPFVKPQNDTSATDKWLKTMKNERERKTYLVLVEFLSLVQSFTAQTVFFFSFFSFFSFFIQEPGLLVCNWLWWWWPLFWLRCHLTNGLRGLKIFTSSQVLGHRTVGVGCMLWKHYTSAVTSFFLV